MLTTNAQLAGVAFTLIGIPALMCVCWVGCRIIDRVKARR